MDKKILALITFAGLLIFLSGCEKSNNIEEKSVEEVNYVPLEYEVYPAGHVDMIQWSAIPNLEIGDGNDQELMVPDDVCNIALNKPVTTSSKVPIIGQIEMIVDGIRKRRQHTHYDWADVELEPGVQHVTIDLQEQYRIYAIVIWHCYLMNPVYYDVIVQTAEDNHFIHNSNILFNNDTDNSVGLGSGTDKNYNEGPWGKVIDAKGVKARYVRLYSNGSYNNDYNHYVEVEVYGRPATE